MIELYLTSTATFAPVIINVSQFDYDGSYNPIYLFRVKMDDGRYFSFAERVLDQPHGTVWLIAARPDGVVYEIQGYVNDWDEVSTNSCFKFYMPKGLTDIAGDVICELVFKMDERWSSNGQNATQNFIIRVEPSPKTIYGNINTIIDTRYGEGGGVEPYEPDEPADEPQYRLVVTSPPTKTVYDEGDPLDLTGTVITLEKYTDKQGVLEQTNVTSACTFSPANGAALKTTDTTVTVTYYR